MNDYYQKVYDYIYDENGKNTIRDNTDYEQISLFVDASSNSTDEEFLEFCKHVTRHTEDDLSDFYEAE